MTKLRRYFFLALLSSYLLASFTPSLALEDYLVTNELKVVSRLIQAPNPYLRGITTLEVQITDEDINLPQRSCSANNGLGWRGRIAFKIVGDKNDYLVTHLGNSIGTKVGVRVQNDEGNLFFVRSLTGGGRFNGVDSNIYVQGYSKITQLIFDTTGWDPGEYTILSWVSDGCKEFSLVSQKLNLPAIPRPLVSCKVPESVYMGDNFGINCQSSLPLVGNNAELEYKRDNTWASASNTLATGNTFSFDKVSTSVIGTLEYRVKVAGVLNLFQESVSESLYLLSKPPKLNLKPYLTIKKLSESGEAFIKLDVGNNQISAMLQTSQTQNGPWRDIGTILSGETLAKNLPFGVWIRVTYLGNGAINAGSSDPFQVLITPTLQCNFPKTITEKRTFQVTCELNQTIKTTPVSLQYLSYGDTWVSLDEGSISGKKSVLKFTLTGGGSSKFRIRSEGLANTYTAFQSNVTQISFKSNTTSTSSKSKNPVGNIPKGKVDKESNAYKFMFNFGSNVAEVSLASDSGMSQCSSAKNSGLIRVRGVPQYLGIQAAQIRSYLDSSSGFQGCLDGFGK